MKFQSIIAVSAALFIAHVAVADDADRALKTNLRHAINQRHVDIDVDKGVVNVDGEVPTDQDRQTIDSVIRSTPGVTAIKNNLKVKFPSPVTAAVYQRSLRTRAAVPVYTTPSPEETTPAGVAVTPVPVIVPDYPKLRVQAWTEKDRPTANQVARQLRAEALPGSNLDNVIITVRNGSATLQGTVASQTHDALIATIQNGGAVTAIYDQLQVK
jgi:osmotically-inducible protein OsmY